ncbi:GNAT family N-acetyltransferase [Trujillonella endophytica]|uniref:Acetyltransferase (GNAT) family protein n=1 Tax=Trujillonella endophytica TaxID=673521 RepID=A0A1H8TGL2_9ACTN|nr:GNAT family N-acetyltransferase [Trujillella endophytica]SEO89981.1 Acetyltransferase (GNAT) family protein [Trujillella endophytica]
MSTSHDGVRSGGVERALPDGRVVRLYPAGYDSPAGRALVAAVQQEYVVRYGGPDDAVVDPAQFEPPAGLFLVAEVDGEAAGCAAWRVHTPGVVEVKRVYVAPHVRRLGLAGLLMDAVEASAAAAGHRSVVLNTGERQPEALALYARRGYGPVPGYGIYADAPDAVFLGKHLTGRTEAQSWAS